MGDDASVAQRFSSSAHTYDRFADVQKQVSDNLGGLLDIDSPSRILEVGCGTGIFTEVLATRFPESEIHALDIAPQMIQVAQARIGTQYPNVRLIVDDIRTYRSEAAFGLVASSSTLQWIDPVHEAIAAAALFLPALGHFVFAMMVEGTLRELHAARARVAPGKLPAGRLPGPREVKGGLHTAGFEILSASETEMAWTYPDAAAFINAIHAMGVTAGPVSAGTAPLTRSELRDLLAWYDREYATSDGVIATYSILYVHAVKAA